MYKVIRHDYQECKTLEYCEGTLAECFAWLKEVFAGMHRDMPITLSALILSGWRIVPIN